MVGTNSDPTYLKGLRPAPAPAEGDHSFWKPPVPARGPLGHLLVAVHEVGASLDQEMVVRQHAEIDVHFTDVPWQHVKPLARGIFTRARYKYASGIRTTLHNTSELDPAMFIEVVQKRPREERTILEYVATLSMWTNEKKEGIGQAATTKCPHCDEEY